MNLGMPEMIFIFILALIIFGPKKMPEVGRQIGKALAEFKKASNDFKMQIEDEIRQLEWEEQQKKIAAATTIEGNAPSYADSASQALLNANPPTGTIAHGSDLHRDEPAGHEDAGESLHPPSAGSGQAPASTQASPAPHETPDATHHHLAQGSDA